jgi:hypothetical protein
LVSTANVKAITLEAHGELRSFESTLRETGYKRTVGYETVEEVSERGGGGGLALGNGFRYCGKKASEIGERFAAEVGQIVYTAGYLTLHLCAGTTHK